MGNKIIIYESPASLKVWKEFNSLAELEQFIEFDKHPNVDVYADQVSVNGVNLLGWDELDEFLN